MWSLNAHAPNDTAAADRTEATNSLLKDPPLVGASAGIVRLSSA